MRILLTSPIYPGEGEKHAYGFVHSRAKIYRSRGIDVQVFSLDNYLPRRYVYEGIGVVDGPLTFLPEIVQSFDPDLIVVHSPAPELLRYLKTFQLPISVWIHGVEVLMRVLHHYFSPTEVRNNIQRASILADDMRRNLFLRQQLRKVAAIVYVSRWMERMANRYLLLHHPRSFVIPNPVDVDLFRPLGPAAPHNTVAGISVRALEWKYGLDVAVRAFAHSRVKLTILGKGSLEGSLRALASDTDANVEFLTKGVRHDLLPQLYKDFGFFVAPSRTEAQGVAMCEAMACGLPVIASKVGGIPEFVMNEYNGLLVPPDDPASLRNAVVRIASDTKLQSTLALNARGFALKHLSEKIIVEKELQVFRLSMEES